MEKQYMVIIPLAATIYVEIEASSEEEALMRAFELGNSGGIDFEGFDPEDFGQWETEEI